MKPVILGLILVVILTACVGPHRFVASKANTPPDQKAADERRCDQKATEAATTYTVYAGVKAGGEMVVPPQQQSFDRLTWIDCMLAAGYSLDIFVGDRLACHVEPGDGSTCDTGQYRFTVPSE